MPLKLDDLKTIEAYKKAMKMDVTKITPSAKTKFWLYRDVELPAASGSKQKLPVLITLVDNRLVLPALKGKMMLCRGTVELVEGKVAFESEQGVVPYEHLKKAVTLFLGKNLHLPVNGKAENQSGQEGHKPAAPNSPAAPPPPPPPAPAGGPNYAQLNVQWNNLLQRAKQAVGVDPGRKGELTQAADGIPALLSGGNFKEAQVRMARLAQLLQPGEAAPPRGFIPYRASLLQFAQAKSVARSQIGTLKSKILSQFPEHSEFASQLVEELEELNQELSGAVDEAINAASNQASPVTDAVRLKIRKYLTELHSNPLVKQADSNPLGVTVTIAKTLGGALSRIQQTMPA